MHIYVAYSDLEEFMEELTENQFDVQWGLVRATIAILPAGDRLRMGLIAGAVVGGVLLEVKLPLVDVVAGKDLAEGRAACAIEREKLINRVHKLQLKVRNGRFDKLTGCQSWT